MAYRSTNSGRTYTPLRRRSSSIRPARPGARGFTVLELIVVVMVIIILLGLLFGILSQARQRSLQASCAKNLQGLAAAIQLYANENSGWVPRDYGMEIITREPGWETQLGHYLAKGQSIDPMALWQYAFFRCPAHPEDRAATGYVLNAFAFETAPHWRPSGPIRLARVRKPAVLPWIADCADRFAPPDPTGLGLDSVFLGECHDLWSPSHLPPSQGARLAPSRHGSAINVLFLDGHISGVNASTLRLEDFDDHLRERADRTNW